MFKGYDYTELAEKWGMYIPNRAGLDGLPEDFEYIQLYIDHFAFRSDNKRQIKAIAKDIKQFCQALSDFDDLSDSGFLWKSFTEMEDPYSICRLFYPLVGYA